MKINCYQLFRSILAFIFLFGLWTSASATHNRAGEITYQQTGPLTIVATVTTYTKASSISADRDTVTICWGDGSCTDALRTNGQDIDQNQIPDGELLGNDVKVNIYIATHTYGSIGHFPISMIDPNRNEEICNVNFPNPDGIAFYIQTTVTLFGLQSNIRNNSPVLTVAPIDVACVGQPFIHNPGAIDFDGDSLSYELTTPLQAEGIVVPQYESPAIGLNTIFMNPVTGTITWTSPAVPCQGAEYNIAFFVIEHRNGQPIDTLMRDMQVRVIDCQNLPPEIETQTEFCVIAGETLEFDVMVTAPLEDSAQQVTITANGGPFLVPTDTATFEAYTNPQPQTLTAKFVWKTNCNHIAKQPYQVVFRATDDFLMQSGLGLYVLSTLKVVRIKVIGPPPEDLQADSDKDKVELNWENPYSCEDADNEYFRGFTVWKRSGSNPFVADTCETGLAGRGYTRITPGPIRDESGGRYIFVDTDVERGRTYCYRILAEFARLTANGLPFNVVESMPSDEICVQLPRDIPLITKVSVATTDQNNGSIDVAWTKPIAEDLDTLTNPGPYVYELYRAVGLDPLDADFVLVPGSTVSSPTFSGANDTTFTDSGLNTLDNPYSYKVAFYVDNENEPLGFSAPASSVFLSISSTDNRNDLSWDANVPWENMEYIVYRENGAGIWDSIAITDTPEYMDFGLVNEQEYCYYIEARGSYGVTSIVSPLINDSQEACGTPIDNIPPCPPELTVTNICDGPLTTESCLADNLENLLEWNNPNEACDDTDDVLAYNVYFAPFEGEDFVLVENIDQPDELSTTHLPEFGLAGCYVVTAIDSFSNESAFSNIVCIDNCPNYILPNVFTPNSDGSNDLYIPFPYCFIEGVEFQVFNQWGQMVFQTQDPDIKWDGKNLKGKDLAEGTYFYSCRVFEQRVAGISESADILSGYIEIIRGN